VRLPVPTLLASLAAPAALAVALACAGGSVNLPPAANDAEAHGERLYRSHCGACHRLRQPSERTRAEWAEAVQKMAPRAHLGDADRPAVLDYLQAHAKDAGAVENAR
jgi:mono/diheme cytochrome c family protein